MNYITEDEFLRIYRIVKNHSGIDMSRKKEIVQGRLENFIRAKGFQSFGAYISAVEQDFTGQMQYELVDTLTTNHTFFMREFEHFDFLKKEVLPKLKIKEDKKKDLCIWCGAASTGQEPYTMAMLLKDFFGLECDLWDTKVLATDISKTVLSQAIRGIYTAEQIEGLPEHWKRRFLRPLKNGTEYEISREIKEEVIFREFNLMDIFPFKRKMHIIFLRNVMIYFDKETKKQLIRKVYDALEPGGYLFVGRTETIERGEVPFELVQPSIFRKQEAR